MAKILMARVTCLLAALLLAGVSAQQMTPFQGRNRPPKGGVDLYVSPIIDHLVQVDDANYKFTAVLFMLLTWRDTRAAAAVNASTIAAQDASYNGGAGCAFPCTTIYSWDRNPDAVNLCCDSVWLPHLEFINVVGFSQDRVVRYGVRLGPNDSVAWWQHVQGEFYTPMSFRAFPFDKQYLSVQLQYGNKYPYDPVRLIPSATGTQLYNPKTGDELSGWTVKGLTMRAFNLASQNLVKSGSTFSAAGDPYPINPQDESQEAFVGLLWQTGLEIFIEVDRISLYYVLIAILPIIINTWLSLLVFSVNPRHLDTRLGIVVTLFLSLTALQFVIAAGLPSSATVVPTQQLIIVAYCILAGIGVSSIMTFWMVNLCKNAERQRRLRDAKRQFTRRWHSVAHSMGLAASAVAGMRHGEDSKAMGSDGSRSMRRRKSEKQARQLGGAPAAATAGSAVPEAPAVAPAGQPEQALVQQQQLQQQEGAHAALAGPSYVDPCNGGMGVYAASSGGSGGASGDSDDASADSSMRGGARTGLRTAEVPAPVPATDEEVGGAKLTQPAWLWRGCWGRRRQAATGLPRKPGWWSVQCTKFRLMKEEMRRSQDYAMYCALKIDRTIFLVTLVGFNIAVILIFSIQSTYQAAPYIP